MNITKIMDIVKEETSKKDSSVYNIRKYDGSLCMDYLVNSKYNHMDIRRLSKLTNVFYHPFVLTRAAQPFKRYEGRSKYYLNDYEDDNFIVDIFQTIRNRKSTKKYQRCAISLKELYYLLRYSYGVNRKEKVNNVTWKFRPIPSGGGLFASEVYIVILNSQIPQGLYHYSPDDNSLELVKAGNFLKEIQTFSGADPYINSENVSCVVFITSVIDRLYIKYGERGYRFMLLEVGFLSQNMSLIAEALNLGSCMLGGYKDNLVEEFLEIDGMLESIQNTIVIGKKADS
ncbi:SagB family peptide dehydrogenase [Culturomica massiliensis]|jgi:SagB-type dehydrogenase family enzyme|uniref:SagB family peptide dehydrogenase n=1 Tax=Culturomica massiliensis TaxID=1841857 RepID=UPI002665F20F|nr:SagB family peptide dehydrogenase [Culturomica massiliensis]